MRAWVEKYQTGIGVGLILLILVINVVVHHNLLTAPYPGHNDFLSRWEGVRSFVIEGVSPYSDEATLNIQTRIYGRPAVDNEDPGLFVYPFYISFIIWPTVYVDYAWASAVWMVLLEACLIGALVLLLNLYQWQPSPLLFGLFMLYALGDYFAGRGLVLGQPSHVIYALQMLTLFAMYRGHNGLAGASLAASTMKPQMAYMLVPFLLLWALRTRRWRLVGGFVLTFGLLMGASFLLQPDWFGDWLRQVREYPVYTAAAYPDTGSPVWIMLHNYAGLRDMALRAAEYAITALFIAFMLWAWFGALTKPERFLWTVGVTLVVTHLVALRTATPHFVVFNLMIVFYLWRIQQRWRVGAVVLALIGLMAFSWGQFLLTIGGRDTIEHPALFLPLPLAMFALLWFLRRMWWQYAPQPMTVEQTHMPAQQELSPSA